jgi:hypothetical protein
MMNRKIYVPIKEINADEIKFTLTTESRGKGPGVQMNAYNYSDIAFVSPAAVTHWPRCTGDGNFGTMWGPTDQMKIKFSLDLTDSLINNETNEGFTVMADKLEAIDNKLLDFVYQNQLKLLNRKNLSREECRMLQIRTVRAKYDKSTGVLSGHSVQLSTPKYTWDGMGGKYARVVNVCDHTGAVIQNATVSPGDVVAATVYAAQVYTGVGGDKFGIQWSFEDVSVICQRNKLEAKSQVSAFIGNNYEFATNYEDITSFSEPTFIS